MATTSKKAEQLAAPSAYAQALANGNILRCLPLEVRREVFAFAALNYAQSGQSHSRSILIEASDIRPGCLCEWLPAMCHVNDEFFFETLPMVLKHSTLVIRETYTAYSLFFFLRATGMFPYVYSLVYVESKMLTPFFGGPQFLVDCTNLRDIWFAFDMLHSSYQIGRFFDKKRFFEDHSFRQLIALKHIEKVTIFLADYRGSQATISIVPKWLGKKFSRRNLSVEVDLKAGKLRNLSREEISRTVFKI